MAGLRDIYVIYIIYDISFIYIDVVHVAAPIGSWHPVRGLQAREVRSGWFFKPSGHGRSSVLLLGARVRPLNHL